MLLQEMCWMLHVACLWFCKVLRTSQAIVSEMMWKQFKKKKVAKLMTHQSEFQDIIKRAMVHYMLWKMGDKEKERGENKEKGFKRLFFPDEIQESALYLTIFFCRNDHNWIWSTGFNTIHIQCTAAVLSLFYVLYTLKLKLLAICYVWKVFYCAWTLPYMFCQSDVSKVRFLSNTACTGVLFYPEVFITLYINIYSFCRCFYP